MPRCLSRVLRTGLLASAITLGASPASASAAHAREAGEENGGLSADSLRYRALDRIAEGTPDSRRLAVEDLDRASRMAPDRADLWSDLGRVCTAVGEFQRARSCFERVAGLAPDDPGAQLALGLLWKWEWLASTESTSLTKAIACLMRSARLSPRSLEPRLALTALALARGDVKLGLLAAESAIACDRRSPDAVLAFASASYRVGAMSRADSAFRWAIPRLPETVRRRFTDLSRISDDLPTTARRSSESPADSSAGSIAEEDNAFWRLHDPDLTTSENEAELNFLARVANAVLLFRDGDRVRWDMRAELFARYGIPGSIELHAPDASLEFIYPRRVHNEYAPDELPYPYNMQVWSYPDLGMSVALWDRSLTQTYVLPVATDHDPDPRPNPALIAHRPDLVMLGEGRGVYRALAPGVSAMPARAELSRFPSLTGARLVAHLSAPGGPLDTLTGWWAVVSSDGREVARGSGSLSISECAPTELRVATFDAEVPPGEYRVDVAVSDRHERRGVVHLGASVAPASLRLDLSDLVLLCGEQAPPPEERRVRIEPNLERRVHGARAVTVYFEADHLGVGADGRSHFAYTYRVRPASEDERHGHRHEPVFEASREDENVGPFRRQFVTAPLRSVTPGVYDFEVEFRDLLSGDEIRRAVRFVLD